MCEKNHRKDKLVFLKTDNSWMSVILVKFNFKHMKI